MHAGDAVPAGCELYVVGGGEDLPAGAGRSPARSAGRRVRSGGPSTAGRAVLAVCAGLQILGTSFVGPDGVQADGLGLVDCATRRGRGPRAVGEIVVEPVAGAGPARAQRVRESRRRDLGRPGCVARGPGPVGVGNGDGSGTDGVWAGRVFGTYLHGPVLARNPALADLLLGWAVGTLAQLDDHEEQDLRAERLAAVGLRLSAARRRADPPVEPGRAAGDDLDRSAHRSLRADHARRRPASRERRTAGDLRGVHPAPSPRPARRGLRRSGPAARRPRSPSVSGRRNWSGWPGPAWSGPRRWTGWLGSPLPAMSTPTPRASSTRTARPYSPSKRRSARRSCWRRSCCPSSTTIHRWPPPPR